MKYAVKLFAAHPWVETSIHCCDSDQKHSVATDRLPKLRLRLLQKHFPVDSAIYASITKFLDDHGVDGLDGITAYGLCILTFDLGNLLHKLAN